MKKNLLFMTIILILNILFLLLFNYTNYLKELSLDEKEFNLVTEGDILFEIFPNQNFLQLAQELMRNIPSDGNIMFFDYNNKIVYYMGNMEEITSNYEREKVVENKTDVSNPVYVSQKEYFNNNKEDELKVGGDNYNVAGIIKDGYAKVNSIDYAVEISPNYIPTNFDYQTIKIGNSGEGHFYEIVYKYSSDSEVNSIKYSEDISNRNFMGGHYSKIYSHKEIYIFLIVLTLTMVIFFLLINIFYLKEQFKIYKIYKFHGLQDWHFLIKVFINNFIVIILPMLFAVLIYEIFKGLNGTIYYFDYFFQTLNYNINIVFHIISWNLILYLLINVLILMANYEKGEICS